jgi:uncharacterized protein YciI
MNHVVLAHLRADSAGARKQLRLEHLRFMREHKDSIIAGGPSLAADGSPLTMILFTRFTDRSAAETFMLAEPYNASGSVFERVEILPWSQVLPEPAAGALDMEIDKEKALRSS